MAGFNANAIVGTLIGIFIAIILFTELVPELQTAGNDLNATGVPLGGLFTSSGIVFVLLMVGLLVFVIKSSGVSKK